ncbi:MAG: sulfurtransferase-like selenium metabolism protein YedF [Desulfobulbaceae bacterium]|nr:sulfurtransferase-like selenium metabolism protein YedF [Desulfobulbaceae bacterium]HIJ78953.1 sulfurtransferase-like selenium metabolism protein YedF [Deltaproteobacteria bacterium]
MSVELNCRGLACPGPVLQLIELLDKTTPAKISVIVDNEAARENVSRFLAHKNFQVTVEKFGVDFQVTGIAAAGACQVMATPETEAALATKKIMVMVGTDRLGHGDDRLGSGLLINFLKTLKEMGPELWRLVLVNNGVKLTVEQSDAMPILQGLAETGVQILVCGTCLEHFELLDKKQVGETTNMLDIVTSMQLADNVINI